MGECSVQGWASFRQENRSFRSPGNLPDDEQRTVGLSIMLQFSAPRPLLTICVCTFPESATDNEILEQCAVLQKIQPFNFADTTVSISPSD